LAKSFGQVERPPAGLRGWVLISCPRWHRGQHYAPADDWRFRLAGELDDLPGEPL